MFLKRGTCRWWGGLWLHWAWVCVCERVCPHRTLYFVHTRTPGCCWAHSPLLFVPQLSVRLWRVKILSSADVFFELSVHVLCVQLLLLLSPADFHSHTNLRRPADASFTSQDHQPQPETRKCVSPGHAHIHTQANEHSWRRLKLNSKLKL